MRLSLIVALCAAASATAAAQQGGPPPERASLDYEYFKTAIQPIFLAKRPGHARCVSCHAGGTPMRLQPLAANGAWTEDASRKNFDVVRRFVVPGSMKSKLLVHPLEESAGGDFYHSGGKHWSSQDDPEWRSLRAWVFGETRREPASRVR